MSMYIEQYKLLVNLVEISLPCSTYYPSILIENEMPYKNSTSTGSARFLRQPIVLMIPPKKKKKLKTLTFIIQDFPRYPYTTISCIINMC